MIDRDQLREALKQIELRGATTATEAAKSGIGSDLSKIILAARLVADPDTLTISKQDGEWPDEICALLAPWMRAMGSETWAEAALDALLEGQP